MVYIGGWGSSKPSLGSWVENFVFSVHALMWYILGDGGQASPHWGVGQKTLYSLCMPLCGIYWGMGVKQALTGELVRKLCILCACPYVVYIGGWGSSKPSLGSWSENFVFSVHALMWYILGDGVKQALTGELGRKLCVSVHALMWYILGDGVKQALTGQLGRKLCVLFSYVVYIGGWGQASPHCWAENFVLCMHLCGIYGGGVKQALTGELVRKLCVLCACTYVVYIGGWGQASPHWEFQKTLCSLCMPLCGIYWGMGSSKPSLGSWAENFVFSVHALMWYILGDGVKQALTGELGRKLCVLCACSLCGIYWGMGSSKPSLGSWAENFVFSVHASAYGSIYWGMGSSKPSLGSWAENFVFSVHALMWYILGVGSSKPSLGQLGRKLCVLCACPYVVYIGGWGQASPHWGVGQKTLCSLGMPLCGIYWGMGSSKPSLGSWAENFVFSVHVPNMWKQALMGVPNRG